MSDVVDLKARIEAAKPQFCFTCPCGHQAFVLRVDARVECRHCGVIQDRLLWGQYFSSPSGKFDSTPLPATDSPAP